jgi:hypothetical protein
MEILEIALIVIIGIAAAGGAIALMIRDLRGNGTCSSGACSSCSLAGRCMDKDGCSSYKTTEKGNKHL